MLGRAGYYVTETFNLFILYPIGYGQFSKLGYRKAEIFGRIKCEWEPILLNNNEIEMLNKTIKYDFIGGI